MKLLNSCPACGSRRQCEVYSNPDEFLAQLGLRKTIRYSFCGGCSLMFANPRMTDAELAQVYDSKYWMSDDAYERTGRRWRLKPAFVRDRLRVAAERYHLLETLGIVKRFGKGASCLEVGSSAGFLLSILKRQGWKVQGVEPTPLALFAQNIGVPTRRAFFDRDVLKGQTFDLVSLMHVFEHLEDPVGFLKLLKGSLAPGGLLWLELPDLSCPRIVDLTHPHLYVYSANTIASVLARAGFRPIHLKSYNSRNAAFQVLHVFAEVGRPSARPRRDDFRDISRILNDARRLHQRKQSYGTLAQVYDRASVPERKF